MPDQFGRTMAIGGRKSNIIPFGSGGRGSIISNTKQVGGGNPFLSPFAAGGGGSPIFDETYDERTLNADAQYDIAQRPWDFKEKVFGAINPFIQSTIGGNANFGQVGGSNTPLPTLPNSFVFSPEQTQQAVNAARAQGDQSATTQKSNLAGDLAGRGFSQNSPLAMAMRQGADQAAMMSNADQEREIRLGHADRNSKQGLAVGQLANQQWQDWNSADIERRRNQVNAILGGQQNLTSLLSLLAGLA